MDTIIRGVTIYLALLVVIRLSGRRTLGEMTSFDFVLLLIVRRTTSRRCSARLLDHERAALIVTLCRLDIALRLRQARFPRRSA
jgi:uncharacterized membrane protein YcaP (DUF421 family)